MINVLSNTHIHGNRGSLPCHLEDPDTDTGARLSLTDVPLIFTVKFSQTKSPQQWNHWIIPPFLTINCFDDNRKSPVFFNLFCFNLEAFQNRPEQISAGFDIESYRKSKAHSFLTLKGNLIKAEKLYSAVK